MFTTFCIAVAIFLPAIVLSSIDWSSRESS